jgi:hypothetical protein
LKNQHTWKGRAGQGRAGQGMMISDYQRRITNDK